MSYLVRRAARLQRLRVRGLDVQLYRWGHDAAVPLLLLHGWGDTAATFQFLIDAFATPQAAVGFDWRGFGRTEWAREGYWYPDYLADLDAMLDVLVPEGAVDVVGHSMGGNIALLYAGIRPQRVRRVVSLEGFGMRRTLASEAPERYRRWLDECNRTPAFRAYDSLDDFARVLARRYPRIPLQRIDFIARSWARQCFDGRVELLADPRHKYVNPVLYQRE